MTVADDFLCFVSRGGFVATICKIWPKYEKMIFSWSHFFRKAKIINGQGDIKIIANFSHTLPLPSLVVFCHSHSPLAMLYDLFPRHNLPPSVRTICNASGKLNFSRGAPRRKSFFPAALRGVSNFFPGRSAA